MLQIELKIRTFVIGIQSEPPGIKAQ